VRAARATKLEGVALRRAQRTTARIRAQAPGALRADRLARREGELLLGENDASGAALEAAAALARPNPTSRSARRRRGPRAGRARARRAGRRRSELPRGRARSRRRSAEGALGRGALALERGRRRGRAPALSPGDHALSRSRPDSAEARYAIGRIQQESGRYDEAFDTYDRLAREQPRASVASEARWRAGWVRYLAGDLPGAASYFARVADDGPSTSHARPSTGARASARRSPEPERRDALAPRRERPSRHVLRRPRRAALGQSLADATPNVVAPPPPASRRARRARTPARRGRSRARPARLARRELDAVRRRRRASRRAGVRRRRRAGRRARHGARRRLGSRRRDPRASSIRSATGRRRARGAAAASIRCS
jgi:tetratricopeptide (TPR) repeat protein